MPILFLLGLSVLLTACGSGPATGPSTSKIDEDEKQQLITPATETSPQAENEIPQVTLEPEPPGQFDTWRLTNNGPDTLLGTRDNGLDRGHLERLTTDGRWVSHTRFCCRWDEHLPKPLLPGTSMVVKPHHAPGEERLPEGKYRFLVPFVDHTDAIEGRRWWPEDKELPWMVVTQFTVAGHGQTEIVAMLELLPRAVHLKCTRLRIATLRELGLFTPNTMLHWLHDAPLESTSLRIEMLENLMLVEENHALMAELMEGAYGREHAVAAAVVASKEGCNSRWCEADSSECGLGICGPAQKFMVDEIANSDSPHPTLVDYLPGGPDQWPSGLLDRLIHLLGTTESTALRAAIASRIWIHCDRHRTKKKKPCLRSLRTALKKEQDEEAREHLTSIQNKVKDEVIFLSHDHSWPFPYLEPISTLGLRGQCLELYEGYREKVRFTAQGKQQVEFEQCKVLPHPEGRGGPPPAGGC